MTDRTQRAYLLLEVTDGQVAAVPRLFASRRQADEAFDGCVDAIEDRGVEAIMREQLEGPRELMALASSDDGEQEVLLYTLPLAGAGTRRRRQEERPAETVCPDHNRRAKSKMHSGVYCPERLDNGNWCKWEVRGAS